MAARRGKTRGRLDPTRLTRDELLEAVAAGRITPAALRAELARRAAKRRAKKAPKRPAKPKPKKRPAKPSPRPQERPAKRKAPKPAPKPRKRPAAPKRPRKAAPPVKRPRAAFAPPTSRRPKRLPKPRKPRESAWARRIRLGVARGLTPSQAAGRPHVGELSARILHARPDELFDEFGPTPLLEAEIRRLVRDEGRSGIVELRGLLLGVLGSVGSDADHVHAGRPGAACARCGRVYADHPANGIADIFERLGYAPRVGFNVYFADRPEVGWDY